MSKKRYWKRQAKWLRDERNRTQSLMCEARLDKAALQREQLWAVAEATTRLLKATGYSGLVVHQTDEEWQVFFGELPGGVILSGDPWGPLDADVLMKVARWRFSSHDGEELSEGETS